MRRDRRERLYWAIVIVILACAALATHVKAQQAGFVLFPDASGCRCSQPSQ